MEEIEAWPGLELVALIGDGNRNEVWAATLDGQPVVVRRSRRSPASLAWELELLRKLTDRGFTVPVPVSTATGSYSHEGVVVQYWIDGVPPSSEQEWRLVAAELQRLHATCTDISQRPGCMVVTELDQRSRSVDADMAALPEDIAQLVLEVFASFDDVAVSLIHGDPGRSNIRITDQGEVGLLDWDESRVDVTWHDLSNLGVIVLDSEAHRRANQLSDAWEAINAWTAEPDYARVRLQNLLR